MAEARQAIKVVARRTGLSAHVIRIWEKRYGAVEPARTGTNRRLYSDEQIERLSLLRHLTQHGHSIGHVANLPTDTLRELAKESCGADSQTARALNTVPGAPTFFDQCVAAVKSLDARALDETLKRAATELGAQGLLQRVIAPLAQTIGDLWRDGAITAAHEHFATAIIRTVLGHAAKPFAGVDQAPVLIVATPTGQLHELGALLASAAAANLGWHVTYLGASLPAAEIAGAARQNQARAVALSLVYPEDDPRLEGELTRLRELLPSDVTLLVGGRAMAAYRTVLNRLKATQVGDLKEFCNELDALRRPRALPKA
ncbi:MAG TPA: MerR family transcriptional regulator [Methylomirabilota bacterium]|nr:MerR family transcriptional regulator [Methylomirabilota bacterium]